MNPSSPLALSRRNFLKATSAIAVSPWFETSILSGEVSRQFAYVGTYTGAVGAGSNGEGIYRFEMNPTTGELSNGKLVAASSNPSWIAIHPSGKFLYAVNEVDNYHGDSGSVSSFEIDKTSGNLKPRNVVSSEGAAPAYISLNTKGTFAFVANYGGGGIAVLPIHPDGSLGNAVDLHRDSGSVGSTAASNAPPSSFAISGHDAPHAHIILPDLSNKFVLVADLGQDRIFSYSLDSQSGKLTPNSSKLYTNLPSGDGPRHLAFHPNGKWLYSIQEESSTLVFFRYDPMHGTLDSQQSVSTLPPGFEGTSFASEVLVSPSGKNLYAANRLHDTIAVFSIGNDGHLEYQAEVSTMGDYPGQCRIDPSGSFLYACNRKSDAITTFKIDRSTGLLTFTGKYTGVGSPASITFMPT